MILKSIKQHLQENRGDESVSKMTWVAIIFIIGAILLLLTTTAFRGPINNWYNNTVVSWFSGEHGHHSYDQWSQYERNENGTYKGLNYVLQYNNGEYVILNSPGDLYNTSEFTDVYLTEYNADGVATSYPCYFADEIKISSDGRTISIDGQEYRAQLP